jgi:lysophospholipase L1-like esterase
MGALGSGCNDNPTTPTGPGPTITCPASASAGSADGRPVPVTFAAPTTSGGTPPLTTSCAPASGSLFPVGSTTVTCSTKDADQRGASCSFSVSVTTTPRISATRFLAFGDSLTAGVLATGCPSSVVYCPQPTLTGHSGPPLLTFADWQRDLQMLRADLDASSASYPLVLSSLLKARYTAQDLTMVNEGLPGETATEGARRLPGALTQHMTEVLLLQEGVNDLHGGQAAAIPGIVSALQSMIRQARGRGARVFLATLLPERGCSCRSYDYADGKNDIAPANEQIRAVAAAEGAELVDLYPAFSGETTTLLGLDGLHPNEAGYSRMAELFFAAITQRLEE